MRTAAFIDARRDRIDPTDRGLAYGDGLFETMLAECGRIRWLDYHLDRLEDGCGRLAIEPPPREELRKEIAKRVPPSGRASVKLVLTRGAGPRGYAPPPDPVPTIVFSVSDLVTPVPRPPVRAAVLDLRLSESEKLAGIKHLCRIEQVLIQLELAGRQLEEGIVLTRSGHVAGCAAANVFMIADDAIRTPAIRTAGVAGVMRRVVIETARSEGIDVIETDLGPEDLLGAQSLFLTNALVGIRAISHLDDRPVGRHPYLDRLRAAVAERDDA